MAVIEGTTRIKEATGEYDFAVDGGALSTITLRSAGGASLGASVPAGAVITSGYIEVDTAVASGTGTVAVTLESASDILAATGEAGLTVGRKSIVPAGTGVTSVKTTVARDITITIATAALTAGKFRVVLFYK